MAELADGVRVGARIQLPVGGSVLVGHVGDAIRLVGGVGEGVAAAGRVRAGRMGIVVVVLVQFGAERFDDLLCEQRRPLPVGESLQQQQLPLLSPPLPQGEGEQGVSSPLSLLMSSVAVCVSGDDRARLIGLAAEVPTPPDRVGYQVRWRGRV
ncbi:hypothetical protein FQN60_012705 [Etheostoma spectabile]|uniref:Uncharacterized protein n=1 Tax=Etheostoma spectabile TaxID=54343 RepID=A0A5J5D8R7_9PERO|nr:hypothetical protein FQN60_012705 [Etheostoma spectabile]